MGREQVPSLPVFRTFRYALTFVSQHMLDGDSSSSPYGSGLLHQKVSARAFAPHTATESCNRIGQSQPSYPRHCSFNPSLVFAVCQRASPALAGPCARISDKPKRRRVASQSVCRSAALILGRGSRSGLMKRQIKTLIARI